MAFGGGCELASLAVCRPRLRFAAELDDGEAAVAFLADEDEEVAESDLEVWEGEEEVAAVNGRRGVVACLAGSLKLRHRIFYI